METTRVFRKSGYTQKELAGFLHIDEATFSQKKSGYRGRRFSADEIRTLALYGVPVAELFPASEIAQEATPE